MDAPFLPTLLCALALAAVHIATPKEIALFPPGPRSRWLSLAGGIAVAYVFMHLLPELAEHERTLRDGAEGAGAIVYGLSLAGLVMFYGLERQIRKARDEKQDSRAEGSGTGRFWLHIGSFAAYNLLIGYLLLHREENGLVPLLLYSTAMAMHFFSNDFALRRDHEDLYDHRGRWALAGAVLVGWLLGATVDVPELGLMALFSFLSGAIVLNVLKEELPEERKSRFLPFLTGVAGYGALLAVI